MTDEKNEGGVSRLSFIKASAGVAAGMAAVAVPTAAVTLSDEEGRVVTKPSATPPREPVMAYIRDAERGEVTVMQGTRETTYRDQGLVRQLLSAAPERTTLNGGIDVLAP